MNVAVVISLLAVSGCSADNDDDRPTLEASFDYHVEYDTPNITACIARSVSFEDSSSGDPTSWSWSFPDGTNSQDVSPTISPADVQAFRTGEVTLTVRRGDESDSATERVEIVEC